MWTMESMATSGWAWTKLEGELGMVRPRGRRAWGSGALELPESLLPGPTVGSAAPASPRLFSYSRQAPTARSVPDELQTAPLCQKVRK